MRHNDLSMRSGAGENATTDPRGWQRPKEGKARRRHQTEQITVYGNMWIGRTCWEIGFRYIFSEIRLSRSAQNGDTQILLWESSADPEAVDYTSATATIEFS